MRRMALRLVAGFLTFFTLLFGVGTGYAMLTESAMPNMGKQMAPNQCQTTCTAQQAVAAPINKKEEQDKEPQPADPYYVSFIGVGWTTTIIISAAYLFGYLRWRPPDLFKLNVSYLF